MNPFFSIIIAVYNREDLISRAINSLLEQNFDNWECIIINDGSTDNTEDVIKKFLSDERFIYHKIENCGVAGARNFGIDRATGKYITFLDSDDEYKKNHLSSRFKLLKDGNIDLLHGGVKVIGDEYVPDKDDTEKLVKIEDCVVGGTFFINNLLSSDLKKFNENVDYSEDSELFERFKSHNLKISETDQKTYIYNREVEDSICNQIKN